MRRAPFAPWAIMIVTLTGLVLSSSIASADKFPNYKVVQPNKAFWVDIYAKYPTTNAVVHDSKYLNIVYGVIDLKPYNARGARKVNRRRMKAARAKYRRLLRILAANPGTKNPSARRVAALFGPKATAKTYEFASHRVRCQIGQRDRFRAGLIRSGAYIEQIRAIFKANGLPAELAYLPHVESSFNYKAYSKFGAAGIWQFTRSTGKRFMKVGYVLDERRDPLSATHAAAALLKENHGKLGNWPLAITAYNHGSSGMARAKRKYGTYPVIFKKYRSRSFKFASRNFYSEFLAAVEVASNYEKYFGKLHLDGPLPVDLVTLEHYISLEELCEHYKISVELAKSLNPALRPPVFNGQKYVPKGYKFRLPAELEVTPARIAAIPDRLYKPKQRPSRFYTVQRGDTAGRVAKRHGVRLSDLILANNLGRRATIYPRQTLRIPVPGEPIRAAKSTPPKRSKPVLAAKTKPQPKTTSPNKPNRKEAPYPAMVLASVLPTPAPAPSRTTLPKRPSSPALEATLPLDGKIPSAEVVSVDVRIKHLDKHPSRPTGTIQVEVEETLGHLAEWTGVRAQRIRRLNSLSYGEKLHLHQKVKIPLDRVSAEIFEQRRYEYHKRLQEDFFAVYRIGGLRGYRVRSGDSLWNLSRGKFDVPMWLLKNCNPEVDFAALMKHQKLVVPTIEKHSANAPDIVTDTETETGIEPDETDSQSYPNSVL